MPCTHTPLPRVQIHMALPLPDELVEHVADFLQSALLSHICHRTWALLQRRYVTYVVDSNTTLQRVLSLKGDTQVHVLRLTSSRLGPTGAQRFAGALQSLPSLRTLTLDLNRSKVEDEGARALAELRSAVPTIAHVRLYHNPDRYLGQSGWSKPSQCTLGLPVCF